MSSLRKDHELHSGGRDSDLVAQLDAQATRQYRILHIDDDPALARLVQKTLEREGYAVETATDGPTGLRRIAEGGIDAVVLDHYLPSGEGLEILSSLVESSGAPPVVYVTASSEAMIAVEALKAGAADYVMKTAGEDFFALLSSAIDQAIAKDRLKREKERAEREVRAARDRAEILLSEVNHRVANSLSLVASLVRMQAGAIDDPRAKDVLAETEARIAAIGGLHRRLYTSDDVRSVDMDSYLKALVSELETSMKQAGHQARIKLDLDPLSVATDKAVSIGMIVTELLTNAYKYAYPDNAGGEVRVIIKREGGKGAALLTVEDDGVGWDGKGEIQGSGLGTRIVQAMAHALGGSIIHGDGVGGTRTSIEIPVE